MAKSRLQAAEPHRFISVRGAREHNLKNVDVDLPRDRLVVITGLSGSGKSSLAFDTIYAEGQRRYVESLSAYARQFLELMQKPDVDSIEGLSPAISIEQKTTSRNPRSTVGTVTEIYDYLRLLFARVGVPYSPATGLPIESQTVSQMVDRIKTMPDGTRLYLMAPIVRGRKGEYRKELQELQRKGFQRVKVDGRCSEGYFLAPTVFDQLDAHCRVNQEEVFGPLVTLVPFDDEAQALAFANSTQYGLACSVWTGDLARAHRFAAAVEAGVVWINCWMARDLRTPFGGVKHSGLGREGGSDGMRFFTEPKNVAIAM